MRTILLLLLPSTISIGGPIVAASAFCDGVLQGGPGFDFAECSSGVSQARAWASRWGAEASAYGDAAGASASWKGVLEFDFAGGGSGGGLFAVCMTAYADYYPIDGSGSSSGFVGPWGAEKSGKLSESNCDYPGFLEFKPFVFGVSQRFDAEFRASGSATRGGGSGFVQLGDVVAKDVQGSFMGITYSVVQDVPEPSTSLFAVVGLAALLVTRCWARRLTP